MPDIPLHPAIVHLPLGLALVMPLIAAAFAWARWKGRAGRLGWSLAVLLQALVLVGGKVAEETGEDDEHRVEEVTGHAPVHEHEEAAERFVLAAAITTGVFVVTLALGGAAAHWLSLLAVLATLAVAGLGLQAGKLGGELVYHHGAAKAYDGRAVPEDRD